jgi:copper homeostasis protein
LMLLEVIGFDLEGALAAEQAGAHRIELCAEPTLGGTTPQQTLIHAALQSLQIPVYVMIRPRGGDFIYSNAEFDAMKQSVKYCKSVGCQGIVFGILTPSANIDIARCAELLALAQPMKATFHRAFDVVAEPLQALEQIIELGFERILTSGQEPTAPQGIQLIKSCVKQAAGRIIIMPGSGVVASTLQQLITETEAQEYHTSAKLTDHHGQYLGVNTSEVHTMVSMLSP